MGPSALVPSLLRSRMVGNAALYTLGGVLQRGAALLILPIYTFYLSPADFGIWSLLLALFFVLVTVADLGMRSATLRLYYERQGDAERLASSLATGFFARLALAGVAVLLLLAFGEPAWERLVSGQVPFRPFAPLLAAALVAELALSYMLAVLRAESRAGRYVVLVLVQTFLQLAGSLFFIIVLGQGALGPLNGLLLATAATGGVASMLFLKEHLGRRFRFDAAYLRECLAYGLPLVPHHLSGWLRSSADRFVLVQFLPLATVGIYHLGYSAGLVIMLLAKGVNLAYEPYYYRLMKTHPSPGRIIRSVAGIVGAGLGGVCLVGVLFAGEIFALLLAPEYQAAAYVTPLILVSYLLHGVNTQLKKPLFYYRRTLLIPWLTGVPAVVTLGLCFVFIPIWGMMAAVWLTLANHLVVTLLVGAVNRRLSPGQYPLDRLALCLGLVLLAAVWVTYPGTGWIPDAVPPAKLAFLAAYAGVAWLLLVRRPLAVLQEALPRPAASPLVQAGPPR